jgi:hypothetical protein
VKLLQFLDKNSDIFT